MKNEALLIGLATVCLYLFSYGYSQGYLSYFGVGREFVSVELINLVDAGAGLLILAAGPLFWMLGFGRDGFRRFALIAIYGIPAIFPAFLAIVEYLDRGFSNRFGVISAIALIAFGWLGFDYRKVSKSRGSKSSVLEGSFAAVFLNKIVARTRNGEFQIVVVLVLIAVFICGLVTGQISALQKREFFAVNMLSEQNIYLDQFRGSLLIVLIEEVDDGYQLTNNVKLIPIGDGVDLELRRYEAGKVSKGSDIRASFSDYWNGLKFRQSD